MNMIKERSFSDCLTMLVDVYISLDLNSWQGIAGWVAAILLNVVLVIGRYKYSTIEYTLMILSVLNVIYLWWWSYKIYQFFCQKKINPNIPNTNFVSIGLPWYARNSLGYFIYQKYYDKPFEGGQKVLEIYMWNPNKFCLNLFYGFSPVQVGILMLMNKDTRVYSIILAGVLALQMYFYAKKFTSLVRDKETIFREVQHEYDMKFVKPRVFRRKRNAETQTAPQEIMGELSYYRQDDERYKYPKKFDNPWATK